MNIFRKAARPLGWLLSMALITFSLPMNAHGAMMGTHELIAQQQLHADREHLIAALDRADVQRQLAAFGVDPQQAKARVASMTDEEIASLDGKIKEMPAGGDILGIAVFIFLVLLVTDIAGYTHIFPFVNHGRR